MRTLAEIALINPRTVLPRGEPVPFVEMAAVQPGTRWVERSAMRASPTGSRFIDSDVLLARITPCLENGKIAQYRGNPGEAACGSTEFVVLRAREDVTNSGFLYYLAASDVIRGPAVASMAGASGRQRVQMAALEAIEISLPPLETQSKIAAILTAYDDLIDNHRRRIQILEEMAQRIYQGWLIDRHYPGHKDVPLMDSDLGPIPQGWTWLSASEALMINPRITVERTTSRPFIPMTSLSEHGMHITPIEERVGAGGSRFVNGDTLFARITPCLENGKTAFVQCLPDGTVASGSTEFIVLRSRHLSPELTYLLARDERFRSHAIQSMSGATGRQRVRHECFDSFWVPIPPQTLLDSFVGLTRPIFKLSYELFVASSILRAARDLLARRLISGQMDVTDLDIAMPEAAV